MTLLKSLCPMQECAQELARCLADGGDKKGTQAYLRIHEIISARVRACATSFVLVFYS